jgi:flagellar biosynthesis protein
MEEELSKKKAVALGYDAEGDESPRVTAKGRGYIAEEIVRRAKEHNVPVYEDEHVVSVLEKLELGDYIPPQLYMAVAEIICFTLELEGSTQKRSDGFMMKVSEKPA